MSKQDEQIKIKLRRILQTIPHLSGFNRDYWLKNLDALNSSQIKKLDEILKNAQKDFDNQVALTLNNDKTGKKFDEIKTFLNKITRETLGDIETDDRKNEQKEIDKLLDQL
ncbi:hypothetical protein KKG71_02890 [Patescibacteria group bacterium]|nr:hypothetical protein [Patescibacteria group bacterium]